MLPLRFVADHCWAYLWARLDPHHRGTAQASLEVDILSYLFFLLLIGTTFLL